MSKHEFMSLREFLLLPDFDRPLYKSMYPHTWVLLYDLAKRSFEKYGPDGPPQGSFVFALRDGFSGSAGKRMIFDGTFTKDPRCFILVDKNGDCGLSMKNAWFREFIVKDDITDDELRKITLWYRY